MFNTALDYIFIKFIVHLVFLYSKGLSLDSDGVNDANFLPPFSRIFTSTNTQTTTTTGQVIWLLWPNVC
jgi:hypothetical protein